MVRKNLDVFGLSYCKYVLPFTEWMKSYQFGTVEFEVFVRHAYGDVQ